MSSFYFTFYGFGEEGAFSSKEEKIFALSMVEHFDGVSFEYILQFIVLKDVVWLPAFFVDQAKAVDGVYFDSLGDVEAFFDDILSHFFGFIVGLEIIEVDEFVSAVVGESQDFVVGQVIGEAEAVEQHEVDVFGLLLRVFEGVADEGTN